MTRTASTQLLPNITLDLTQVRVCADRLVTCVRDCWFAGADGLLLPATKESAALANNLPGLVPGMSLGFALAGDDTATQIEFIHQLRPSRLCLSYATLRQTFSPEHVHRMAERFWEIRATVQWQFDSDLSFVEAGVAGIPIRQVLIADIDTNDALRNMITAPGLPMAIDWAVAFGPEHDLALIQNIRGQNGKLQLRVEDLEAAPQQIANWQPQFRASQSAVH